VVEPSVEAVVEFAFRYDQALRAELTRGSSMFPTAAVHSPRIVPENRTQFPGEPAVFASRTQSARMESPRITSSPPPELSQPNLESVTNRRDEGGLPSSNHSSEIPFVKPSLPGSSQVVQSAGETRTALQQVGNAQLGDGQAPAGEAVTSPTPLASAASVSEVARATVLVREVPTAAAPFTLAPSRAPLAPSTPFQTVPLPTFVSIVVAIERGADPAALLPSYGLSVQAWSALSRDMFARTMRDNSFASVLNQALVEARTRR
jgi:hypothetical protein